MNKLVMLPALAVGLVLGTQQAKAETRAERGVTSATAVAVAGGSQAVVSLGAPPKPDDHPGNGSANPPRGGKPPEPPGQAKPKSPKKPK